MKTISIHLDYINSVKGFGSVKNENPHSLFNEGWGFYIFFGRYLK